MNYRLERYLKRGTDGNLQLAWCPYKLMLITLISFKGGSLDYSYTKRNLALVIFFVVQSVLKTVNAGVLSLNTPLTLAHDEIILGCNPWPPYIDTKAEGGGSLGKLITQAFTQSNIKVNLVSMPWPRVLKYAQYGKFDGIAAAYYTNERAEIFLYSKPYAQVEVRVLKNTRRNLPFNSVLDLQNRKVAIIRGTSVSKEFDLNPLIEKVELPNYKTLVEMLKLNRIDFAIMEKETANTILAQEDGNQQITLTEKPLAYRGIHLMVSRDSSRGKELIEILNRYIEDKITISPPL